jgi:V8-like Glu-specific endopeptidase
VLRYRTPTESGSSGSPVFDQEFWTVIGLHHAALKTENEAIAIRAIQEATGARPSTTAAEAPDPALSP